MYKGFYEANRHFQGKGKLLFRQEKTIRWDCQKIHLRKREPEKSNID